MLKNHLLVIFAIFLFTMNLYASSPNVMGKTGIGAELGGETSVSFQRAYDIGASLNFGVGSYDNDINVFSDHLWFLTRDTLVHPYVGLGLAINFVDEENKILRAENDDVTGQLRLPIGLSFYAKNSNLNLFAQLVPRFDTTEDNEFFAQLGLRYFFR